MANLNKVLLIGRLTRDPEQRYTPSGAAITEFGLAVNRYYKGADGNQREETAFVDVTTWGRQAELAKQYLAKGRQVFLEGRLKFDQWTTQDGQKRSKLSVTADTLQFLDSRGEGGSQSGYGQQAGGYGQPAGGYGPQAAGPADYGPSDPGGGGGYDQFGGPPSPPAEPRGYPDSGGNGSGEPPAGPPQDDIPF